MLKNKPKILLGGHSLDGDWRAMFKKFWSDYKIYSGDHPLFKTKFNQECCVPFFIHGDEGRGQLKRPFMVISTQFAIGRDGPGVINDNSNLACLKNLCSFGLVLFSKKIQKLWGKPLYDIYRS